MDNNIISGTLGVQLDKLKNVSVVDVRGKKCVLIPVEDNKIYISQKGTVVLSLFMSKLKEEAWGKTHSFKRKLTKDEFKTLTKEQKDANPIVGYFEPWRPREDYNNNSSGYAPQAPSPAHDYDGNNGGGVGDLPF